MTKYLPTVAAISVFLMAIAVLRVIHHQLYGTLLFYLSLIILIATLGSWIYSSVKTNKEKNLGTGLKLGLLAVAMFGFSYVMVPFFHLLCHYLGINGAISAVSETEHSGASYRSIPTNSIVTQYSGLDWQVRVAPEHFQIKDNTLIVQHLIIENISDHVTDARLKIGFSPGDLSRYLHPTSTIQNQVIHVPPHGRADVSMQWILSSDVPAIKEATIHYALFPMHQPNKPNRKAFLSGE